ncbi:MAG: gamma carbonic anhydrase family protein [Candidatus Lokiarchaeota archaeon]|nr:gamma carbonic anhydrase family protein [Candidatus Lokiarchaeota archaeon]
MIVQSPFDGTIPQIHPTAFIAKDAVIIGDVEIGAYVNMWFGAKIRGDWGRIVVGENTSIQENCVIHSTVKGLVTIGKNVTLGHLSMVHGPATIGDSTLIGISASVLQNSTVGTGVVLAGGSVIRGQADDNCLYAGVPAIKKKEYSDRRMGKWGSNLYVENGQKFKAAGLGQEIPEEYLMKV